VTACSMPCMFMWQQHTSDVPGWHATAEAQYCATCLTACQFVPACTVHNMHRLQVHNMLPLA
jgi:hypothetical protein